MAEQKKIEALNANNANNVGGPGGPGPPGGPPGGPGGPGGPVDPHGMPKQTVRCRPAASGERDDRDRRRHEIIKKPPQPITILTTEA